VNYFSNLFSAATIRDMELHIQPLSPRVIEEMNVTLRKVLPKKRLGLHSNKLHL
jgi:hypothetical protein